MAETNEEKVCAACGDSFGCGAKLDGCWCADVNISTDAADEIRSKYAGCLCPQCLQSFSTEPAVIVTYPDGAIKIISGAVRIDTQNFHEGMFDFYDERGNLLEQIDMGSGIEWEAVAGVEKAL